MSSPGQAGAAPPPAKPAQVPESTFASQLARALKLGPIPNGAKPEELLSGLGINPKNGWVSERLITPGALNDIEKGISTASEQKKIAFTKDQALKLFGDVKAKLGLSVNPTPKAPAPKAPIDQTPGNMVIYRYTDSEGVIHFTDIYDSIPEEYRKDATKNLE